MTTFLEHAKTIYTNFTLMKMIALWMNAVNTILFAHTFHTQHIEMIKKKPVLVFHTAMAAFGFVLTTN